MRKKIESKDNPEPLEPAERKYVSTTAYDYEKVIRRLFYVWEESLRINDPTMLSDDGKFHFRQLYAFRKHNFIEPHDIREFLDSFSSPNIQSKMAEAYHTILTQLYLFARSTTGKAPFSKPITDDEFRMSPEELRYKGKVELNLFLQDISNTQKLLKIDKPYVKWKGERLDKRNEKMEAMYQFEGMPTNPDPKVILDKWNKHESTIKMNRRIVEAAENKEVVSPSELLSMTNHLIIMYSTKNWTTDRSLQNFIMERLHQS